MSDRVYDIEQHGRPKLVEIVYLIYKARINAKARSTDLLNEPKMRNTAPPLMPGRPCAILNLKLSRIRETPGLTDKVVGADPALASGWFLDYENAVKEVLNMGQQTPELAAMAFGTPSLYTITSKLPFTLSYKI